MKKRRGGDVVARYLEADIVDDRKLEEKLHHRGSPIKNVNVNNYAIIKSKSSMCSDDDMDESCGMESIYGDGNTVSSSGMNGHGTVLYREFVVLSDGSISEEMNASSTTCSRFRYEQKGNNRGSRWSFRQFCIRFRSELHRTFLPIGYPSSVRPEYLKYQVCDSIQGLLTYVRGMASTAALLKSSGVGDAEASAVSASLSWAMRDGIGMIGGLLFSYTASPYFDGFVKEFRLLADLTNDIALCIDISMPYLAVRKRTLIVYSALSAICKSMCGMAGGASKSSISAHFAMQGNMADINAKEQTQETLITLIGMLIGIFMTSWFDEHVLGISVFYSLTIFHMLVNYIGVDTLRLRTLNCKRAQAMMEGNINLVASSIVSNMVNGDSYSPDEAFIKEKMQAPLKPEQVHETLFEFSLASILSSHKNASISLGTRVEKICFSSKYKSILQIFRKEKYLIDFSELMKYEIKVVLNINAKEEDKWRGYVHALVLQSVMNKLEFTNEEIAQGDRWVSSLVPKSYVWMTHLTKRQTNPQKVSYNLDTLKALGWETERLYLGFDKWRIDF